MIDKDPDDTTKLAEVKDRSDAVAAAQAQMIERTLAEKGDQMDVDTKSRFLVELLGLRGQLESSARRSGNAR